jgi:hypothetical protein
MLWTCGLLANVERKFMAKITTANPSRSNVKELYPNYLYNPLHI